VSFLKTGLSPSAGVKTMTEYFLRQVEHPQNNPSIYHTISERRTVYDFRQAGLIWSSPTGIYVGIADVDDTLLQLQNDAKGLIICSRHDGIGLKARAHERLIELGITPEKIIAVGLQQVRQELKDGVRRSLENLVNPYFLGKTSQDTAA
jgi:hypothetical protein